MREEVMMVRRGEGGGGGDGDKREVRGGRG